MYISDRMWNDYIERLRKVNDTAADAALSTTITWTDITPGSELTAVVQSGDYRVQIRMNYSGSKWNITR